MTRSSRHTILLLIAAQMLSACGKAGCDGPALDLEKLNALRGTQMSSSGPGGFLVMPNPIDAIDVPTATLADTRVLKAGELLPLFGLLDPKRLENAFLKIRIKDITDSLSTLAAPNQSGAFNFRPDDIHYSEVMAYQSVTSIKDYVEALGFSVVQSRPLYVMVQAAGSNASEVNAYYDHGYLNESQPRTIKLFGATNFAPGIDRDMYWHEFGHLFNESLTREIGLDYAGDTGAVWTEGAALHECLSDYLAESVGNKDYIGKWIARNLSGFKAGDPLRSAADTHGKLQFRNVITADGTGARPERYEVAEWCTRVLWEVREKFVDEDREAGPILSDRVIFAAATKLKRDASLSEFQNALYDADEAIHCGGHESVITDAFEGRGFKRASALEKPLSLSVGTAQAVSVNDSAVSATTLRAGASVVFSFRIQNNNSEVARNVRVRLESMDAKFLPITYMQAFGDINPRSTVSVGTTQGLSLAHTVMGEVDKTAVAGSKLKYRLRLLVENAQDTVIEGVLQL